MRCDFGVPLSRAPYGFIEIFSHPGGREIDLQRDSDRLEAILVKQEGSEGMNLVAQRKFETAVGRAFCLEFGSGKHSVVNCYFDKSTLSVEYEGSEKFTGDVYEVVNSAHRLRIAGPSPMSSYGKSRGWPIDAADCGAKRGSARLGAFCPTLRFVNW